MAFGLRRLCWCLVFAFAIISSARDSVSLSGDDDLEEMQMEGRYLRVKLNDYNEASANRGHDPRTRISGGGRKGRDSP